MTAIIRGANMGAEVAMALRESAMVVTDDNVAKLYPQYAENAFVIPSGEKSKNKDVLFSILDEMHMRGLMRGDTICAFGGGVVGDVTGLAASMYMRGIDWICIPTTLLAMVDSGLGGKTAINFCGVKNLIGAFHFPKRIVISYDFCDTLDEREKLCGIGEIIKTCLLTRSAYALLKQEFLRLREFSHNAIYPLIEKCIEIKNKTVNADPTELGLRKVLNVGHTVGHALESADGFKLSHGEYVLKGIMTECAMFNDFDGADYRLELIALLKKFVNQPRTTANAIIKYARCDKKNDNGSITIMLPTAPGEIFELRVDNDEFIKRYTQAIKDLKHI